VRPAILFADSYSDGRSSDSRAGCWRRLSAECRPTLPVRTAKPRGSHLASNCTRVGRSINATQKAAIAIGPRSDATTAYASVRDDETARHRGVGAIKPAAGHAQRTERETEAKKPKCSVAKNHIERPQTCAFSIPR